ncbi:hypothetical protein J5U21_01942 [Saccharolobus shibatae]|uniref:Uncharacterized protein n=1 Tax=Saccharolobus shibatae TaxID=2286 RepID=A0A8F5BVZ5_9CREN|nr:hypothetical protein J5U21_01942 [Saccharolobus shibatae]
MELITIDEKALYGTPLNEAVKELGQNLTFVPNILPENALLNKSVKEIEKMALEEAEKTSPKHQRGKEIRRKGYARWKFLKGFKMMSEEREVIYKLEWIDKACCSFCQKELKVYFIMFINNEHKY